MATSENDKKITDLLVDTEVEWLEATTEIMGHTILKEIPILRTVVAIIKGKNLLSEKIAYKKLERFFHKYDEVTKNEVEDLLSKIHNDTIAKREIGEKLVILIDSYNDFEKPEILALVFVAYLKDKITLDEFLRIGEGISLAYISDLKELLSSTRKHPRLTLLENLASSRFTRTVRGSSNEGTVYVSPKLNDIGNRFINCLKQE